MNNYFIYSGVCLKTQDPKTILIVNDEPVSALTISSGEEVCYGYSACG
jgi:hypothetical protein